MKSLDVRAGIIPLIMGREVGKICGSAMSQLLSGWGKTGTARRTRRGPVGFHGRRVRERRHGKESMSRNIQPPGQHLSRLGEKR